MPAAKPKYMPRPRGWTQIQVATRLGISLSLLSESLHEWQEKHEFPKPNRFTGRYNAKAVDVWIDREEPLLAKLREKAPDLDIARNRVKEMSGGTARA